MAEPSRHTDEQGAALLTVLLLVAVMAVITALAFDRLVLSTRLAQNAAGAEQGQAWMLGAEQMAALRLGDLAAASPGGLKPGAEMLARPFVMPVPGGTVTARVRDADNCFNLNGLVQGTAPGTYVARPEMMAQFATLMRLQGIEGGHAQRIAAATADWLDGDAVPLPGGAEDPAYLNRSPPYRTAGGLLVDPGELLAVAGVTPDAYRAVRPLLCTLPVAEPAQLNVNMLRPDQAPLLAMLAQGRLPVAAARQVLARRPVGGYASIGAFWSQPALAGLDLPGAVRSQTGLTSRWFALELKADQGGVDVGETVLLDAIDRPARIVRRVRGEMQ